MLRLSVIIITHNRQAALMRTLDHLVSNSHLPHDSMEVIVIDNGCTDDTSKMVRARHDLRLRIIRREQNEGVSARNYGFAEARGDYLLLIDDDSFPIGDAVERSLARLDGSPMTAAVVGRVELSNGKAEASALPGVIANGAVCLRKRVIDEVGGLPREFFRQAEEYDLSFRIWNAGYVIERYEDLVYFHDKAPGNRELRAIHRFDLRNNLILIERYLPRKYREVYRRDWVKRYSAFARNDYCRRAAFRARIDGLAWRFREIIKGRQELSERAFESLFQHERQTNLIKAWARTHHIRRAMIADFSKNIYATWRACRLNGLEITGLYDRHVAFGGMKYRGIPIVDSLGADTDGMVLSNVNPAQVEPRIKMIRQVFPGPVLQLWESEDCPISRAEPNSVVGFRERAQADVRKRRPEPSAAQVVGRPDYSVI